jgi:transcription termination/antitermination protein NusA
MNGELLRLIDSIHRSKDISLDILFEALEDALSTALRKKLGTLDEIEVSIDRTNGEMTVEGAEEPIDAGSLGRIAAQTAKQVIIQKIREAERDVILHDYEERLHDIVNGTIQRTEGGNVIVNLGKTEGILPRREQVREEKYRVGDRVRCYVQDVRKAGSHVRIILSRSHPDLIRELFKLEVPEISERIIEIKCLSREPGYRTKIAVYSIDSKVDAVGACVGVRGTRIKNIVAELGGEKIDIVRWSDQDDIFIANALNPAEIEAISLNPTARLARVIVAEDQLSRAIGSLGQNVRLASKVTGWDIDVMSQKELDGELEKMESVLGELPGVGKKTIEKLYASGFSMKKLGSSTVDNVTTVDGVGEAIAGPIINTAAEFVARERVKARAAREAAQRAPAPEPVPLLPPLPPLDAEETDDDSAADETAAVEAESTGEPEAADEPGDDAPDDVEETGDGASDDVEETDDEASDDAEEAGDKADASSEADDDQK